MSDHTQFDGSIDPKMHAPIGRLRNLDYPCEVEPGTAKVTIKDSAGRHLARTSGHHVLSVVASLLEHDRAEQALKRRRKLINEGV